MAKSIFVADDERTAKRYATDPKGPYRFYYHSLFTKLQRGGRAIGFKTDREQPDEALNVPTIVEQLVIYGTPERVTDQLLALREQVGDFGTLLYAGHDWTDKHRARRSMELMAAKVMPASTPRSARARQSPDRKTHPMGCRVMAGLDPVLGWRSCDSHARAESGVNSLATGLTRHPPSEKAPRLAFGNGCAQARRALHNQSPLLLHEHVAPWLPSQHETGPRWAARDTGARVPNETEAARNRSEMRGRAGVGASAA